MECCSPITLKLAVEKMIVNTRYNDGTLEQHQKDWTKPAWVHGIEIMPNKSTGSNYQNVYGKTCVCLDFK